jgi:hypothetical protein
MSAGPPIPDELWQQIPLAAQATIRALIQHYEQRLAELEARLKQNSANSSKPPSSDPPTLKRAPPKVRFAGRLHAQRDFRVRLRAVLARRSRCVCAKTAGTCRELLHREVSLLLFAFVSGVEPTNNAVERALRHGMLWRKTSHGPKSVVGSEYLGCIWSAVETCRQQDRGVWDFLTACMAAAADGRVLPSLLTLPNTAHAA